MLHRQQPGITDHNGNKCKNITCNTCIWGTLAIVAIQALYVHVYIFVVNKFITIMVVIKI